MGTTFDYIEYVLNQIEGPYFFRSKKMFGEYMVYVEEKPTFLVCDNIVYVKMHPSLDELLQNAEVGYPYDGAKLHYVIDIDNKILIKNVIDAIIPHLKVPKKKIK
ncbi:hypothetical protein JV173_02285 [Acholeplasma equirhinis]|uniref:hypothetical protein n=1 Tax=Acholeplasma equirhinis TaxID=555393 RepID=UPI00197AF492|nr:hypothetical protein [Acholeplasma equirhinis]MBN3490335.1 hypothetical protein [Acholeplasma equirhinis]